MNEYESLLIEIKLDHTTKAKEYVPKLCYILKKQDPLLSDKDVGKWVIHDLIDIWSKSTIYENLPEEFKDDEKSKQTKEGIKQKKVRERSPPAVGRESSITIFADGQPIDENPESEPPTSAPPIKLPDLGHNYEISREELELKIGKLEEQLKEQSEYFHSTLKAINDNKSKEVTESKEYKALESQIYLVQEENKELKHVEAMHIKEHPEQTFQSASSLPVQTKTKTKTETEVQFPAKEISTFFMDARNVKNVMYLQIKDNVVVGWQSDYIRNKAQVHH